MSITWYNELHARYMEELVDKWKREKDRRGGREARMGRLRAPWKREENLTVGGHLASPFLLDASRGCARIPGVAWVYVARAVRSAARSGDPSVVLHWLVRKGKEKSGVPTAVPVNAIMFRRWQTHSVLLTARRNLVLSLQASRRGNTRPRSLFQSRILFASQRGGSRA